jgi:predicted TIM-barrel fold metal-dependent hydrolase
MEEYGRYCPPKHRDAFAEQLAAVASARTTEGGFAVTAKKAFGYDLDPKVVAAADRANGVLGGADSAARHADMDHDGVAADVILHGLQNAEPIPFLSDQLFQGKDGSATGLEGVGCHMYNQWVADFISTAPERHAALAYVSLHDMDGAIKELEWARNAGLRGVNFPAPRRNLLDFTNPFYEPLFAACADLDMPLTTHTGAGDRWSYEDGVCGMAFQKIEGPFVARRGVWQLIFGGVFERYPSLKLVLTEVFGIWVPEMVRDLDFAYLDNVNPLIRQRLPKLPSEYWMTNCYVGASFMSPDEAALYPDRGASNLMWGSDYPHIEGTHPYTRDSLRHTFAGLPPSTVAPLAGLTAAQVYGLDLDKLRPVADRIGPTVEELSTPPASLPGDDYVGLGFRQSSAWPADSVA